MIITIPPPPTTTTTTTIAAAVATTTTTIIISVKLKMKISKMEIIKKILEKHSNTEIKKIKLTR